MVFTWTRSLILVAIVLSSPGAIWLQGFLTNCPVQLQNRHRRRSCLRRGHGSYPSKHRGVRVLRSPAFVYNVHLGFWCPWCSRPFGQVRLNSSCPSSSAATAARIVCPDACASSNARVLCMTGVCGRAGVRARAPLPLAPATRRSSAAFTSYALRHARPTRTAHRACGAGGRCGRADSHGGAGRAALTLPAPP
jgi:hypothetical protein